MARAAWRLHLSASVRAGADPVVRGDVLPACVLCVSRMFPACCPGPQRAAARVRRWSRRAVAARPSCRPRAKTTAGGARDGAGCGQSVGRARGGGPGRPGSRDRCARVPRSWSGPRAAGRDRAGPAADFGAAQAETRRIIPGSTRLRGEIRSGATFLCTGARGSAKAGRKTGPAAAAREKQTAATGRGGRCRGLRPARAIRPPCPCGWR